MLNSFLHHCVCNFCIYHSLKLITLSVIIYQITIARWDLPTEKVAAALNERLLREKVEAEEAVQVIIMGWFVWRVDLC